MHTVFPSDQMNQWELAKTKLFAKIFSRISQTFLRNFAKINEAKTKRNANGENFAKMRIAKIFSRYAKILWKIAPAINCSKEFSAQYLKFYNIIYKFPHFEKCEHFAFFRETAWSEIFPFRWKPLCVCPFLTIHMESSVVKNQIS